MGSLDNNKYHKNTRPTRDLICRSDPKYTAELLLRSHEGLLSEEQEVDLQEHLKKCERCYTEYKSLNGLNSEMLLAAKEDAQLRKFSPNYQHAEKCLLTTSQRLERFAEGSSEDEFISDEEIKKHIDECVYCRRRSIITHQRISYGEYLPLAYHLAEQATQEALNIAYSKVWETIAKEQVPDDNEPEDSTDFLSPYHSKSVLKFLRAEMEAQSTEIGTTTFASETLRSGGKLKINIREGLVRLEFPRTEKWVGKPILLISKHGQEFRTKLSNDAIGLLANVPSGKYQIVVSKDERYMIQIVSSTNKIGPRGHWPLSLLDESQRYSMPVYCYLRRKGYDKNEAVELTQSFFYEIVSGQLGSVQELEHYKYGFRTFLLTALKKYFKDIIGAKRILCKFRFLVIDIAGSESLLKAQPELGPEQIYHYVLVLQVLNKVSIDVRDEYLKANKYEYWAVFEAKIIQPTLDNTKPPTLKHILEKYNINNEAEVSKMILSVKRRFFELFRSYLGLSGYIGSDSKTDENEALKILLRKFIVSDPENEEELSKILEIPHKGDLK